MCPLSPQKLPRLSSTGASAKGQKRTFNVTLRHQTSRDLKNWSTPSNKERSILPTIIARRQKMGDTEEVKVDPCKQNPCKASLEDYNAKSLAVTAAADATKALLNNPPTAMSGAAGVAGAVCGVVGAGIVLGLFWTGIAVPVGGAILAGGVVLAGISAKIALDWKNAIEASRAACAQAHIAFEMAKDKVTSDCPKQCWPNWTYPQCA